MQEPIEISKSNMMEIINLLLKNANTNEVQGKIDEARNWCNKMLLMINEDRRFLDCAEYLFVTRRREEETKQDCR